MSAIVEVFQSANKKTKTGMPRRWRWRITDGDSPAITNSRHSFRTEAKALNDIKLNAVIPDGAVLRRPDQPDQIMAVSK